MKIFVPRPKVLPLKSPWSKSTQKLCLRSNPGEADKDPFVKSMFGLILISNILEVIAHEKLCLTSKSIAIKNFIYGVKARGSFAGSQTLQHTLSQQSGKTGLEAVLYSRNFLSVCAVLCSL